MGRITLIQAACLSRVVVVLLAATFGTLFEAYDTSQGLDAPPCDVALRSGATNRLIGAIVAPLCSWDGVHFIGVAENGYTMEKSVAWFPGFPLMIRWVHLLLSPLLNAWLCPRTISMLSAVAVANVSFVGAVACLHQLCLALHPHSAALAPLLLCASPANIFLSAAYSEAPFALFSFLGMLLLARNQPWNAALSFFIAASIRSNAVLYGVLFVVADGISLSTILQGALVAVPLISHLGLAYGRLCLSVPLEQRALWCFDVLPNAYGHVQSHYWGNGFLRYWTVGNVPNFLLASPVLMMSAFGVAHFVRQWNRTTLASSRTERLSSALVILWGAMACMALFVMNVQVATRFLSSCPPFYWFGAYLISQGGARAWLLKRYAVCYTILGCGLFSTFYPWT